MRWKKTKAPLVLLMLAVVCSAGKSRYADWPVVENGRTLKTAMHAVETLSLQRRNMHSEIKIAAPFLPSKMAMDGVLAIQPQDYLRLDIMNLVDGVILAGLDLKPETLELWLPQQNRVYVTDSNDDSISKLTHLPWTLSELFSILSGLPPKRFNEEYTDWSIDPDGVAVNGEGDAVMSLMPGLNIPETFLRYKNEKKKSAIYEVTFDDYRPSSVGMFPYHVTVQFFHPHKRVEMWFDHVEWNPKIPLSLMESEISKDAKQIYRR